MTGLTLVELMMAVFLVGVLLALGVPAWTKHRNTVLSRHTAQDITMMATAIEAYAQANREYPDSLAQVQFAGRLDPWGNPYVYYNVDKLGRGGARKDRRLNPINSDFDLYSRGADRLTNNQVSHKDSEDDILRGNNGRFFGLGAQF
jgi:general secretion pathway protein G